MLNSQTHAEPMQPLQAFAERTATNRTPRRINRDHLFNLIRTRQPISRADLARLSGLQRSTVSLIAEELLADRWIVEGSIARLPRGRHPTFLQLNHQLAVIALDIHPMQTSIGLSDLGGVIIAENIVTLSHQAKDALATIVAGIRKVTAAHAERSFVGVGICLPGRTDVHLQKLIFSPNLTWPVSGIKSRIERSTGLRVAMDNVANACALSEVWFGEKDRSHDLVVVNVSEGIGTGIFANGKLIRGDNGMAGEFGHVQLDPAGLPCSCGGRGCWETLASNRACLRIYRERVPAAQDITFHHLLELAQAGDSDATCALTQAAVQLGRGIRMIVSALAPKEIIIVGDITSAWSLFGPIIEAEMRRFAPLKATSLRPSHNGDAARLRSAVALVLNEGLL